MVFIKLPMADAKPSEPCYFTLLQEGCADIIQTVATFEGMLAHISCDDKGVSNSKLIKNEYTKSFYNRNLTGIILSYSIFLSSLSFSKLLFDGMNIATSIA
jgi:hypothetical protein